MDLHNFSIIYNFCWRNLNDLDELQAKLTKKVAELEGVGG